MGDRASDTDPKPGRALVWGLLAVGCALRLAQYLANRSVSLDESYLALNLIERSIGTLKTALIEEAIVVSLVIVLFLLHVRSSLLPIIGDRVSATMPETITAPASVNANSRNRAPVNPPWMPTGA